MLLLSICILPKASLTQTPTEHGQRRPSFLNLLWFVFYASKRKRVSGGKNDSLSLSNTHTHSLSQHTHTHTHTQSLSLPHRSPSAAAGNSPSPSPSYIVFFFSSPSSLLPEILRKEARTNTVITSMKKRTSSSRPSRASGA